MQGYGNSEKEKQNEEPTGEQVCCLWRKGGQESKERLPQWSLELCRGWALPLDAALQLSGLRSAYL
jgi:hypothetical protein